MPPATDFSAAQERRISTYFRISVFLKGVSSLGEVIAGTLAFFVPVSAVTNLVVRLVQGELAHDPTDFIATHLVTWAHQLAFAGSTFVALYLLSRGLIKLLLVVALLKEQLWAYPSSLVVLGAFVLYQCYQIALTMSGLLVALTLFDLVVMYFIWREWEVLAERLRERAAGQPAQ